MTFGGVLGGAIVTIVRLGISRPTTKAVNENNITDIVITTARTTIFESGTGVGIGTAKTRSSVEISIGLVFDTSIDASASLQGSDGYVGQRVFSKWYSNVHKSLRILITLSRIITV